MKWKLNHSLTTGISFGITSAVVTTLGLMIGLGTSTESKIIVLGGILSIAFADAFSDAMGIHVSEESELKHTKREIWESTIATFISKLAFALTFAIPILLFSLGTAILIAVVWGLLLMSIYSIRLAKKEKIKPYRVVAEHIGIIILVIIVTYFIGTWIRTLG